MKERFLFVVFMSVISGFLSCRTSQEITEDYRTETYKNRMSVFSDEILPEGSIVFFGNSITQAGKWSELFPAVMPVNRGISGDNTEGMLARIGEVAQVKPSKFFIMAGINDISLSRSEKKILGNYRKILHEIKAKSPETEIFIQSVLPVNNNFGVYSRLKGKEERIVSLNRRLRILAEKENAVFINLYPYFCDEERMLDKKYTGDGLHLNDDAYQLWAVIIRRNVED